MRKLMWFVIGFTAACAVSVYLFCGNWLLLLCFASLSLAAITLAGKEKSFKVIRLILLGCAAAFFWVWLFHSVYLADLEKVNGESISCSVQITDYSEPTDWGIAADGKVELDGKTYRIRIYSEDISQLTPGEIVSGTFRVSTTFDRERTYSYQSGNGIYLVGTLQKDVSVTPPDKIPLSCYSAVLRNKIVELLNQTFPEDTLAFARALLLGDRSMLDYSVLSDLSVSGIRHVVAVSGLHVSILFSLVFAIFGYRRFVTPIVGGCLLLLFTAVTGFAPSVVRAAIMHGLMLGAMGFQKEYDPPTALSFAVLSMLAVNPMVITSAGFQLSVGCLVGIFLFSEPIRNFILSEKCLGKPRPKTMTGNLKVWAASSVSMTLSTWITTTPLCAAYFETVSLVGVLTNLLTLWLLILIFWGILVVCLVGAIFLPLGQMAAWLLSWPIRVVLWIARLLASFPLAAVYTKSVYIVLWLIFCYVLFVVTLFIKKRQPWLLAAFLSVSLIAAVAASWAEAALDTYRFTVLDVGQGQCILIQDHGKHYIVDCGGDLEEAAADEAVRTLLSQGITRLDGVIITHYDDDHAGGVTYALSRIPAEKLYLPDIPDSGNRRSELETLYADRIVLIPECATVNIHDSGLTLYTTATAKSDNESSMCVLFQAEKCDILITGDRGSAGEKALLAHTDLPDLDVLVVGHHGSKGTATLELLTQTHPEVALISVSQDNPYGHPAEDVLERLHLFDCKIMTTAQNGTLVIRG